MIRAWVFGDISQPKILYFVLFQHLINLKKVLDFQQRMLRQVAERVNGVKARVGDGDGQNLMVFAPVVVHQQRSDRAGDDEAAAEGRVGRHDQHAQRLAPARAFGSADPAVIAGVVQGRKPGLWS